MDALKDSVELNAESGPYYLGFKIRDTSALESMRGVFEKIKRGIWTSEERYPEVHRTRFNKNFKHINLWSANIDHRELPRLAEEIEKFTEEHTEDLKEMKVTFSRLSCKPVRGKIYVALKLHFASQELLRRLQEDVIASFGEFQNPASTRPYDLHCSLLYLNTQLPLGAVESVVNECSEEVRGLEATLQPFILSHRREILYQYPKPSSEPFEITSDVQEWIPRSLCLMWDCPDCSDEDALEIIRSIGRLSCFDFEDYMIERCHWEMEYYKKGRIVAVFRSIPLRDDFHRYFMRYLAMSNWELFAADVIENYPENFKVGVYKALSREKDSLHFYAEEACYRELPRYRSKVDSATSDLYLQQLQEPYHQHYFDTRSELDELIDLLKQSHGREYVSSVC